MQRTGVANFTLDYGRCPKWLFERMRRLARAIGVAIVSEFGADEFLRRLSDPVWFQSFGSVLAFDWNASGLTTTTMAAIKEGFEGLEKDLGIFVCGGKGKTSRKTPQEIMDWGAKIFNSENQTQNLIYASKATAKVDTTLIQDGFQIYHHNLIFSSSGKWAVIQQGMNIELQRARRYHWLGEKVRDLTLDPHSAINSEIFLPSVLNLASKNSLQNRDAMVDIIHSPGELLYDIKRITSRLNPQQSFVFLNLADREFHTHPIMYQKYDIKDLESPRFKKSLNEIFIKQPKTLENMMMTPQVGPKTIRALSLVAEIIYGARPSFEDPARYTFAHGGKDGTPYPVDRNIYDKTLQVIERAVKNTNIVSLKEKDTAVRQAHKLFG